MIEPNAAALILIDMQRGFIDENSGLYIAGAAATVPACARALQRARDLDMRVFHAHREYASDGSTVEAVRYEAWVNGGKPLSTEWPESILPPRELTPLPTEEVIRKRRFSAFFGTKLDTDLRDRSINTVILAGTTTPNCVRATCLDALSLDYNVVVLSDATSSRPPEVQQANIDDMAAIGAQIMTVEQFERDGLNDVVDYESQLIDNINEHNAQRAARAR